MEPRQRQVEHSIERPCRQPKSRSGGLRRSYFDRSEVSPLPHAEGHHLAAEAFAEGLNARVVEIQDRRARRAISPALDMASSTTAASSDGSSFRSASGKP